MADNHDRFQELNHKLDRLLNQQTAFQKEINQLRAEIEQIRPSPANLAQQSMQPAAPEKAPAAGPPPQTGLAMAPGQTRQTMRLNLEKFIGENLINKIGILITIIGVAIGARYAIDRQLIDPLTRIILGYLSGIVLFGFAVRLKKTYVNFSAVLLSGAMAVMYFITFTAYSLYELMPQGVAFALMVVFTGFTTFAAIMYNRQVIALIGLVGAYAIPFLLSRDSGRFDVLFAYTAIINSGILVIAFKKYWKVLYNLSFIVTWLIFSYWYFMDYHVRHFTPAMVFLFLFFIIFYLAFLGYKLVRREKLNSGDIILLLANSFIFYGLGYHMIDSGNSSHLLGLFTVLNAVLHFAVAVVIYRKKLGDRNLFYLVAALALVFATIAIPVQLDGKWVTLLWVVEAALLFWIGRGKNVPVYEKMAYPLMILAFFSILHDWAVVYKGTTESMTLILNVNFLSSLIFIACFAFIQFINSTKKFTGKPGGFTPAINYLVPSILIIVSYYAFRMEIEFYWDQLYTASVLEVRPYGQEYSDYTWNADLTHFRNVWILSYSLVFLAVLTMLNVKWFKNSLLGTINLFLNAFAILALLTVGLYALSELRESYLIGTEPYIHGVWNLRIRYISLVCAIVLLFVSRQLIGSSFIQNGFKKPFELILHLSILWFASSELLHWMDLFHLRQSYKLSLSILWGTYALFLVVLGIWKNKQILRISAMLLFGIILIKLFFYDLAHFDTIAKTVVFVSLGVLMLVVSYLYNRYKGIIINENDV